MNDKHDIKLIISDLDGTLMTSDHEGLHVRTMSALLKAQNKGCKLAIATGRPKSLTKKTYRIIQFVDYIIYSNGAVMYDCKAKKRILSRRINAEKTASLVKMLYDMPLFFNVYWRGKMYRKSELPDMMQNLGLPDRFFQNYLDATVPCDDIVNDFSRRKAEAIVAYVTDDSCRESIVNKVSELGGLSNVSSMTNSIEIISEKAGKGAALDVLCKRLGYTADNVMAFGDASNDCSMLEYAKYSFAMANGDESCKKSAKFITSSNVENGVAEMIEKYIL